MARKVPPPIEAILGLTSSQASDLLVNLTKRERQVAELMAAGTSNRRIAEQLGISTKTLDIHRSHVRKKLQARNAVDVARIVYAKRFGEFLLS